MSRVFLGIDSGTQSTKTVLVDGGTGVVVASQSAGYGFVPSDEPGCREQHPADWVAAAESTMAGVLASSGIDRRAIAGIGISGQQHGFVPLDEGGQVIRPAKLWCDTTSAAECHTIISRLGGLDRTIQVLGNGVPAGFTASKILWLKEHEPDHYARLSTVLLPHDYLAYWLTGNAVMEWGDASGTALMDVRTRTWSAEAMAAIDPALSAMLPELADSRTPAGRVRATLAASWGIGPDVIVTGSGDNMMAAIGTGNVRPCIVTVSLGTSGTACACADHPVVDPKGEVAAFCDATGRWLPLVCTMNVTVATEMVRRLFGWSHEAMSQAAASVATGSDGLLLVPFFEGERTPNVPDGTGVWLGVRDRTWDAAHMARAAMEGATLGLNYGLNRLRQLGVHPIEIRLTGGGSRSAVWRQITADIFGCPVVCPTNEEGAAYGAALHAMWVWHREQRDGVSIEEITSRFVTLDQTTRAEPAPGARGLYQELQGVFDSAARGLSGTFSSHRLLLDRPTSV